MKKIFKSIGLIVAITFIFIGNNVKAQTIIDVPPGYETLYDSIMAHQGEGLTYRLQGGDEGLYINEGFLKDTTGAPLTVIGPDDGSKLPRIQSAYEGVWTGIFVGYGDLDIENVILVGRSYGGVAGSQGLIGIYKDSISVTLKNVLWDFNNLIRVVGKDIKFLAEDCTFMNILDGDPLLFYGRVPQDNGFITFRNCTFANIRKFPIYFKSHAAPSHLTFDHCTFYRIKRYLYHHGGGFKYDCHWKNSLIVDVGFQGYDTTNGTLPAEELPPNLIDIDTLGTELLADRSFSINNNVFWLSKEFKDKIAELGRVEKQVLHDVGKGIIAALDGCKYENNIEFTTDPQLANPLPNSGPTWDSIMVDMSSDFSANPIKTDWRYYADSTPDIDYDFLVWPLPWNLKPTNPDLWAAADDGYPVGDLNWFDPSVKEAWANNDPNPLVGVEKDKNLENSFELEQNYPNPFNPTTVINFTIPKAGITTLSVYNVLGQKVTELVNKELPAGRHKYTFDASNLTSGIYFYKLKSNDYSAVKKMMLIK